MFNFYRKIRRKLAFDNKFLMYSRYAIGEIVLVVVGILIALSINNRNEIRNNEKELVSILKDVHRDLETNIKDAERIVDYYREKDSLILLIMSNKLSEKDYRENNALFNVTLNYPDYKLQENGFNKLMEFTHDIPDHFESIISDLKVLFINDKNLYDLAYESMVEIVADNASWMQDNTTWFHEFYFPPTDESIQRRMDYFLSSAHYKNTVHAYSQWGLGNHLESLIRIRSNAIRCHRELHSRLGLEEDMQTDSLAYIINIEDYAHYAGTYEGSTLTLKISIEGDRIYSQVDDRDIVEEFPVNGSELFFRGYFTRFISSEDGQADSLIIRFGGQSLGFKKIE